MFLFCAVKDCRGVVGTLASDSLRSTNYRYVYWAHEHDKCANGQFVHFCVYYEANPSEIYIHALFLVLVWSNCCALSVRTASAPHILMCSVISTPLRHLVLRSFCCCILSIFNIVVLYVCMFTRMSTPMNLNKILKMNYFETIWMKLNNISKKDVYSRLICFVCYCCVYVNIEFNLMMAPVASEFWINDKLPCVAFSQTQINDFRAIFRPKAHRERHNLTIVRLIWWPQCLRSDTRVSRFQHWDHRQIEKLMITHNTFTYSFGQGSS